MSAIEADPDRYQRMSQYARERAVATRAEELANDPHGLHHLHLRLTAVECSCGEFRGVTTVLSIRARSCRNRNAPTIRYSRGI